MNPVAFTLFGIEFRWYSLLILIAVFFAYSFIMREAKRHKYNENFIFNLIFWTIIVGIIGARVYYVLFNLNFYSKNLGEIYKVWHGGLAIHGGIIFGLITIVIFCKKYNANILKILDIFAPALIFAQAIGRWGNFFNSEAFGSAVSYQTLINLKIIPQFIVDNMYINGSYHLPMFYFESILCLIGFLIMIIIRRKKYIKYGNIISFYLIWYGVVRFFIESFRTDSLMLSNIKVAQIVSIIMIITGIYILIVNFQKPKLDNLYNKNEENINY